MAIWEAKSPPIVKGMKNLNSWDFQLSKDMSVVEILKVFEVFWALWKHLIKYADSQKVRDFA